MFSVLRDVHLVRYAARELLSVEPDLLWQREVSLCHADSVRVSLDLACLLTLPYKFHSVVIAFENVIFVNKTSVGVYL